MKNYEHKLQAGCVRWFRLEYRSLARNLFAIPNGQLRDIRIAQSLKREGVLPGVADLFLAVPSGRSHGLFIEMKIRPNKPTEHQQQFGKRMMESGYHYEVVYSFEGFQKVIREWIEGNK